MTPLAIALAALAAIAGLVSAFLAGYAVALMAITGVLDDIEREWEERNR